MGDSALRSTAAVRGPIAAAAEPGISSETTIHESSPDASSVPHVCEGANPGQNDDEAI
jgi:hypothetical protein